jgi:predicted lipoprotein with Yx(FWY)xxD motif
VNRIIRKAMLVGSAAAVLALPACGAYRNASSDTGSGGSDYGAPAAAAQTTQPPVPADTAGGDGYGSGTASGTAGGGAAAPVPKQVPPAAAPNALIRKVIPKMGAIVTDAKGWTLYRFDTDTAKPPATNCAGKCAQIWPPALTNGNPQLSGVDPTLVGTVRRADGSLQLTLHGWPLYRYIGDPKKGAWKGQGVGGTWWVSAPNGTKNLTCVPKVTPKAVAPPATTTGGGSTY